MESLSVHINRLIASLTVAIVAVLALGQTAQAELLIKVDKTPSA